MTTVEEAVEQERRNVHFQPHKLSQFLYGAKFYAEMREKLDKWGVIPHDFNLFNGGRVDILRQSIKDFVVLSKDFNFELDDVGMIYGNFVSMNQLPGLVSLTIFVKCLQFMGTEEQKKQYIPKCLNLQVVGSYSQTEMAHGSDVASLITTATYNQQTDQFIIDTGDLNGIKYWIGDLGIFCTHTLVFAQLIVEGKNHGVQAFIVPVRDENMKLLPGIEAGDIGPKFGYFARDNGYMIIRKLAIPRKNMLARFTTVEGGKVRTLGNPKVGFAAIMEIRKMLACSTPKIYANAITIATKYSVFRRQFKRGKEEIKIIDYQLQQEKIIQRMAEYFAITLAGNKIRDLSSENSKRVTERGDFSLMQETHVCLSLAKCFFGELIYEGMEICRRACGGHGFSHYSGLVSLVREYSPNNTHEGENTVLYLQVAKHLMKSYKGLVVNQKDIKEDSIKYIRDHAKLLEGRCKVQSVNQWTMAQLTTLLAQTSCYLIAVASQKIVTKEENMSQQEVLNKIAGINLRDLGIMHSAYYCMRSFKDAVERENNAEIKEVSQALGLLFGANFILTKGTAVIQGGFLSRDQVRSLHELKEVLLPKLRPVVIGIIDGFGIPEKYIRSQLTYGNPYENFLRKARECELNKQRIPAVDVVLGIKHLMSRANPKL